MAGSLGTGGFPGFESPGSGMSQINSEMEEKIIALTKERDHLKIECEDLCDLFDGQSARLKKQLADAEQEIERLKAIPVNLIDPNPPVPRLMTIATAMAADPGICHKWPQLKIVLDQEKQIKSQSEVPPE